MAKRDQAEDQKQSGASISSLSRPLWCAAMHVSGAIATGMPLAVDRIQCRNGPQGASSIAGRHEARKAR